MVALTVFFVYGFFEYYIMLILRYKYGKLQLDTSFDLSTCRKYQSCLVLAGDAAIAHVYLHRCVNEMCAMIPKEQWWLQCTKSSDTSVYLLWLSVFSWNSPNSPLNGGMIDNSDYYWGVHVYCVCMRWTMKYVWIWTVHINMYLPF